MKKFESRKLTKIELKQVELLRKNDSYIIREVHIFNDGNVIISIDDNGLNFKLSLYSVSEYIQNWISTVWINLNRIHPEGTKVYIYK